MFIAITGCGSSDQNVESNETSNDTVASAIDTSAAPAPEAEAVKSPIEEVKYSYKETTESKDVIETDAILKSGESTSFNGCSTFKLVELAITGTGKNLSCKVVSGSKVLFEKTGIDITQGFKITNKDVQELTSGTLEFFEADKSIFKHSFETSGCN